MDWYIIGLSGKETFCSVRSERHQLLEGQCSEGPCEGLGNPALFCCKNASKTWRRRGGEPAIACETDLQAVWRFRYVHFPARHVRVGAQLFYSASFQCQCFCSSCGGSKNASRSSTSAMQEGRWPSFSSRRLRTVQRSLCSFERRWCWISRGASSHHWQEGCGNPDAGTV